MKYLITFCATALLSLAIFSRAQPFADVTLAQPLEVASGGSASCPADGSPDITESSEGGFSKSGTSASYFNAQLWPADQVERRICKLIFRYAASGDVSGKTWVCEIRAMSGANLGAVIANGTSGTVTGLVTGPADVKFEWATPPTLAANTAYAFAVSPNGGAADAVNNLNLYRSSGSTGSIVGSCATYDESGVENESRPADDDNVKIYFYD